MEQAQKNKINIKKLMNPTLRQDVFHPTRILYTFVGLVLFTLLGYYLPRVWVQYAPIEYYTVQQPVSVDREIYKPCNNIVATIIRTSSIQDSVHSTVQLYLVNGAELSKSFPLFDGNVIVEKSNNKVYHLTYKLPCDLTNGKYFIQAIINYKVSGIDKSYIWVTNAFTVDKNLTE